MKTKQAKKFALPFVLVVALLMALSSPAMADLPTEDGYLADDTKMNIYNQGYIKGDLDYTYGEPIYQCIWNYNESTGTNETATFNVDANIPAEKCGKIKAARLYVYWTWSKFDEYDPYSSKDYGVYPNLKVEFNGVPVSFNYAPGTNWIDNYTDVKNSTYLGEHYENGTNLNYIEYNFPAGTNCSMIPRRLVRASNVVNVTNVYPYHGNDPNTTGDDMAKVCIQNVGLLVLYEGGTWKKYYVAEGNDMTYCKWLTADNKWDLGITPDMTITKVNFEGPIPFGMNKATLTTVVPAGSSEYNRLYFNNFYNYWDGLWNGNPDPNFAVSVTDVSDNLLTGRFPCYDNIAGFQNGMWSAPLDTERGDKQMNIANAFLVLEHDPCVSVKEPKIARIEGEREMEKEIGSWMQKELRAERMEK